MPDELGLTLELGGDVFFDPHYDFAATRAALAAAWREAGIDVRTMPLEIQIKMISPAH